MLSNYTKSLITFGLSLSLLACGGGGGSGGGSGSSPNPTPNPGPGTGSSAIDAVFQGTWVAEAYGRVIEIGGDSFRLLDYTSEFCFVVEDASALDTQDVESLFRIHGDQLEWYASAGTATFGAPGERFDAAAELPASCADGIDPQVGEAGYVADPRRDLRVFAQLLEEYSIYPALRELPVMPLYESELLNLSSTSSDEALADALFAMASAYRDIHTTVETSLGLVKVLNKPTYVDRLFVEWLAQENLSPPLSSAQVNAANSYIGQQLELERSITLGYAEDEADVSTAASGLLTWYAVDGIGYLAIDAMLGFGDADDNEDELAVLEDALDSVFNDLRDTQALIVDVRRNGGGKDFLSLAIASRFAANETLAYRKQARLGSARTPLVDVFLNPRGDFQYLAPVYLLTSSQTASAAEVFTLAMRELPQVTVLGESTQGGLSDQLDKQLSNGWPASVANEYYLTAEGESFELSGIPADLAVPQLTRETRDEGVDAAIEAVISLLQE